MHAIAGTRRLETGRIRVAEKRSNGNPDHRAMNTAASGGHFNRVSDAARSRVPRRIQGICFNRATAS